MPSHQLEQTIKIMPENSTKRAVKNSQTGRKKTSIACVHCWRAKTRCAVERPCPRCVRLHKTCVDRPLNISKKKSGQSDGAASVMMNLEEIPPMAPSLSPSSSISTIGNANNRNEIVTYHHSADITNAWLLPGMLAMPTEMVPSTHKSDEQSQKFTDSMAGAAIAPQLAAIAPQNGTILPLTTANNSCPDDFVDISQKIDSIMQSVESRINASEQAFLTMLQSIEAEHRKLSDKLLPIHNNLQYQTQTRNYS
mmetsp:Transcript_31076/g.50411  ORF Transcript_31076/g.50411 Transcript_31076/m.50411 type:complete len:252 (-) Transcript_31076:152-907(-)